MGHLNTFNGYPGPVSGDYFKFIIEETETKKDTQNLKLLFSTCQKFGLLLKIVDVGSINSKIFLIM